MLLWDGERGFALDPEKNAWRRMAENPHVDGPVSEPSLLWLGEGKALAAYWISGNWPYLCLDYYLPDSDEWQRAWTTAREDLEPDWSTEHGPYLGGMAAVKAGTVVFVSRSWAFSKVIGVIVGEDGGIRFLPSRNAPERGCSNVAVYAREGKVLYFGHAHVGYNMWSVWDEETDTWQEPKKSPTVYSFGHCFTGNEVYIFGGASGSGDSWISQKGWVYSFQQNEWREWAIPEGRESPAVCWTGEEVLVWGGAVDPGGEGVPRFVAVNSGSAFSPERQEWRSIATENAPSPRSDAVCVWTGKEMVVWGGREPSSHDYIDLGDPLRRWPLRRASEGGPRRLYDCHAYDPKKDSWRRLPDLAIFAGE